MCPSYQATKDEKDSTRARARVLQEVTNGSLFYTWGSEEVRQSLDLCLGCKACSADCPAGVDMSRYKSEALYRAYKGRLRPITDYVLGWLPRWGTLIKSVPGLARLANVAFKVRPLTKAVLWVGGMDPRRKMITFETDPLSRWWKRRGGSSSLEVDVEGAAGPDGVAAWGEQVESPAEGDLAATPGRGRYVVVWADSFSQALDSDPARALVEFLEGLGYRVLLAPDDACCGLTWITTGQLDGAKKRLAKLAGILGPLAVNGVPIVGVEPSCTGVLRDDILDLLPGDPRAEAIARATRTLAELLADPEVGPVGWEPRSLGGVEVVAQPHCHHYAVMGWDADAALLARAGATVTTLAGCCGLAGNFGMIKGHYEVSTGVADIALLPALKEHPDAVFLADGFSCRTQADQLQGRHGVHLAELLLGRRGGGEPLA